MNPIKEFVGRLLFPETVKFVEGLSNAMNQAVQEIEQFDAELKNVCTTWLAVCPHTYVTELFLEEEKWNKPFINTFQKSGMRHPQGCLTLTQGYYLRCLKNLICQEPKYKKFSAATIEASIRLKMANGMEILSAAAEFEEAFQHMSLPDDFVTCYIEKILALQYSDEDERGTCLFNILMDSDAILGLTYFTVESLKIAKNIDGQSGAT